MGILKQAEGGVPVSELCCEHRMSSASFYQWRAKFGGMTAPRNDRYQLKSNLAQTVLSTHDSTLN